MRIIKALLKKLTYILTAIFVFYSQAFSAIVLFDRVQRASTVPFDNSTNGFTATEVQSAIEEAKTTATGLPRFNVRGAYNGVVSGGTWLGPNELLPNTPFSTLPVKSQLNEISWSNQNTNVQFHIEIRTVSKTGTIFHTMTVTSPNSGYGYVTGLSYVFNPGTVIFAQYIDDGTNCSDMDLMLWFSRVE